CKNLIENRFPYNVLMTSSPKSLNFTVLQFNLLYQGACLVRHAVNGDHPHPIDHRRLVFSSQNRPYLLELFEIEIDHFQDQLFNTRVKTRGVGMVKDIFGLKKLDNLLKILQGKSIAGYRSYG